MIATPKKRKTGRNRKVQKAVISGIKTGRYPIGSKLPPGREMAKIFGTSYVTVNSAMRDLETLGHVQRVHGSGIYVTDSTIPTSATTADQATSNQVGAIMPMRGDLYQSFTDSIIHELEPGGLYLTPLPTTSILDSISISECEKRIAKFADAGFASLVISGNRHIPYNLLHKYQKQFPHMVFVMHNESGVDLPASNSVICDYEQVGYLGAKKLLESGRKKLGLLTYEPLSEMEMRRNGNKRLGSDHDIITGIEKAFKEADASFIDNFDVIYDFLIHPTTISTEELLSKRIKDGFDSFICLGDHRAKAIYAAAEKLNLSPGKEIGVIGLYDTVWAEMLSPHLTSIAINEQKIAKIAAKMILSKAKGEKVLVEPTLVERKSG